MSDLNSANNDVYVFGAGLNRCISHPHLSASPPLIEDFFQIAIEINELVGNSFDNELLPLLDYIYKNWRLSKNDLLTTPFNLEKCFTNIEHRYNNVLTPGSFDSLIELFDLRFKLRTLIFKVLSQFNGSLFQSDLMPLGQLLFDTKPGIITFNYDDYVESVIELSSKNVSRIKNRKISSYKWNRILAYGMRFDLVLSPIDFPNLGQYVDGEVFYKHPDNKLYTWSILKLHGSLNWFRFIPPDATPPSLPRVPTAWSNEMESQIIVGHADWALKQHPMISGNYIEPVIVTPDIYKSKRFEDPLFCKALLPIWEQAGKSLSRCKRLVIIGYSFPDSDDLVKNLFKTSFSENILDELIIVNPEPNAVEKAKAVCNYKVVLEFPNLSKFLNSIV